MHGIILEKKYWALLLANGFAFLILLWCMSEKKGTIPDDQDTITEISTKMLASNSVDWLKTQCYKDKMRTQFVLELEPEQIKKPMLTLNRIFGYPLQTQCLNSFTIGGKFRGQGWDGNKVVCLDNFPMLDYAEENCLIYSFGLNRDWSFEKEFAKLGCEVHGYDHTINLPQLKSKQENEFYVWDRGMGNVTEGKLTTLYDAIKTNGHEYRRIDYLKIDIERHEVETIPEWISSGVLANVDQIGIEVHISKEGSPRYFLKALQDLYNIGYRLIAWTPNIVSVMINNRPCCAEIVLVKSFSNICKNE